IRQQAENKCTNRASGQARCDRERDLWNGLMEVFADRCEDKRQNEKIESVKGPSEKTRNDSVALTRAVGGGIQFRHRRPAHVRPTGARTQSPRFQRRKRSSPAKRNTATAELISEAINN